MILTSHAELGDTGEKTGFWLEEFAAPYYILKDAGHTITLASPKGGQPPLDPKSDTPDAQTDATRRFKHDGAAQEQLATTERLDGIDSTMFDAIFYPGGHGPLWDLAEDADSKLLIEEAMAAGKPVALVCHAPAVLKNVTTPDGAPLVRGKRVTGFTNGEEEAVKLTRVVPFLVEEMLKAKGGDYSKGPDFSAYVVTDGVLITGQNPASSGPAAEALMKALTNATAGQPAEV